MTTKDDLKTAIIEAQQKAKVKHLLPQAILLNKGELLPSTVMDAYNNDVADEVHAELIEPLLKRIAELEDHQAKVRKIMSDGIEEVVHRRNWNLAAENAELRFKARGGE